MEKHSMTEMIHLVMKAEEATVKIHERASVEENFREAIGSEAWKELVDDLTYTIRMLAGDKAWLSMDIASVIKDMFVIGYVAGRDSARSSSE